MPPSGYSKPAISELVSFQIITLNDLRHEVSIGKHSSLINGLAFEIRQIETALTQKEVQADELVQAVLILTLLFYKGVLLEGESKTISSMERSIYAIHIDEESGVFTKKPKLG